MVTRKLVIEEKLEKVDENPIEIFYKREFITHQIENLKEESCIQLGVFKSRENIMHKGRLSNNTLSVSIVVELEN